MVELLPCEVNRNAGSIKQIPVAVVDDLDSLTKSFSTPDQLDAHADVEHPCWSVALFVLQHDLFNTGFEIAEAEIKWLIREGHVHARSRIAERFVALVQPVEDRQGIPQWDVWLNTWDD